MGQSTESVISELLGTSRVTVVGGKDVRASDLYCCWNESGHLLLRWVFEPEQLGNVSLSSSGLSVSYFGTLKPYEEETARSQRFLGNIPGTTYRFNPISASSEGGTTDGPSGVAFQLVRQEMFSTDDETRVVEHMNDDHVESLDLYARAAGNTVKDGESRMLGLDFRGLWIQTENARVRVNFTERCTTTQAVRAQLVDMHKAAKADEGTA